MHDCTGGLQLTAVAAVRIPFRLAIAKQVAANEVNLKHYIQYIHTYIHTYIHYIVSLFIICFPCEFARLSVRSPR